jgi:magnesium transporter
LLIIPNIKGRRKKAGLPPGTPVYVGKKKLVKTKIRIVNFDEAYMEEKEVKEIDDALPSKEKRGITWINIDGLQKINVIEKIGKYFNLHPLVLEDIVNTEQRPKMEDYTDYLFVLLD